MSRQLREISNDISEEFSLKTRYLSPAGAPLQDALEYTTDTVQTRIRPVFNDFNQAYRRNEFYMRDICEAGQGVYDDIR